MDITIEPIAAATGKGRDDECEVLGQALSSIPFGCPSKLVVYGELSCDFAHTIDETLKCLTQLPALMQSHSDGDSVASRW